MTTPAFARCLDGSHAPLLGGGDHAVNGCHGDPHRLGDVLSLTRGCQRLRDNLPAPRALFLVYPPLDLLCGEMAGCTGDPLAHQIDLLSLSELLSRRAHGMPQE